MGILRGNGSHHFTCTVEGKQSGEINHIAGDMNIIDFINELRNTDMYIHHIYTKGGCYKFHILLSKMYKNTIPYTNGKHIITRYKGKYYDIYGEVNNQDGFRKLSDMEKPQVEKWSFHMNNLLVLKDCPHCDEPIIIKNLS